MKCDFLNFSWRATHFANHKRDSFTQKGYTRKSERMKKACLTSEVIKFFYQSSVIVLPRLSILYVCSHEISLWCTIFVYEHFPSQKAFAEIWLQCEKVNWELMKNEMKKKAPNSF